MKSGRRRIKLAGFRPCAIAIAAAALWVVSPVSGAVPPTRDLILFNDAPVLPAQDTIDRRLRATLQSKSDRSLSPGSVARFIEPTFWEEYSWRIAGVVALVVVTAVAPVKQLSEARP